MNYKIGIIPIPIYVVLIGIFAGMSAIGRVPSDIMVAITLLSIGGFTCAEIGYRIPIIRSIGAGAIFATFIPSALVYYHLLPQPIIKSITEWTKFSNFLYLFIASIIVGSILGMDRKVLVAGFLKIFIPLGLGTIVAAIVGTVVGTLLGIGTYKTFFFIVVPIMAGGVGEGAIPLSVGYSAIMGVPQGTLFAQILPSVMLGSLTAILLSGTLNFVGKRRPHLTGEGRLQEDSHEDVEHPDAAHQLQPDLKTVGAAAVMAVTLYLVGVLGQQLFDFPAPITMLFIAVVMKLTDGASPELERGAYRVYKFFQTCVTYPLLFAIGVALTPWEELIAAFTIRNLITIIATVVSIMATGYFVAPRLKMFPIDVAIVNACHSGQGGTGDVAILTAANRMQLMPFAQIATRIGGAIVVTLALIAAGRIGG